MNSKAYKKNFIMILLALACLKTNYGQQNGGDKEQNKTVAVLLNSKNYVFVAQTVLPIGGRSMNLTTSFDLRVSGDTVVSNLPYFGRAFVAPINPGEGGIQFTSTDFTYNLNERKKGGWDIQILPKDAKDVRQMYLTVTESGYASLQVISNNRQAISYNGYIVERDRNNGLAGRK